MVAASAQDTVIRCQVQSVEFGFYSDDDVRHRSVIEITSSLAFDPTGNAALPHGLYDARLGPTRFADPPCATCALDFNHCPGHFGHIELAVPVHHPLLLPELLTVLRIKCLACHRLKAAARQLNLFRIKFFFLYQHDVEMVVHGLEREITAALMASRGGGGNGHDDMVQSSSSKKASAQAANLAVDSVLRKYQQEQQEQEQSTSSSRTKKMKKKQYLNSYEQQMRRQLIAECIAACKAAKRCHHCGAVSPKIRQDSSNKIFQTVLGKRDARTNHNEGIVMESALVSVCDDDNDSDNGDDAVNRSSGGKNKNKSNKQRGYDSDDTVTNPTPVASKSRKNRGGGDSDDDGENETMNDGNNGNKGSDAFDDDDDVDDDVVGTSNKRDRFMHTLEVQAQLKRTWQRDAFLMNCLFGAGPHEQDALSSGNKKQPEHGYQRFFMQAIPVPPNRFRPAMQLGGMAVEHGQTQYLSKMMQHNEQVRTHFAAAAAVAAKDGDSSSAANNDANTGEPRAYAAWIELQTTVNCFMDASKDPSATPIALLAPGIRQILERKEGLFRKNMMGKRVDYACRSVISPDPYIGTNEIGLPRYFATVLTYPTPVMEWNIREMRQLVERGPHNYPGARWVEVPVTTSSSSSSAMSSLSPAIHQPTSRRVDLTKMTKHKREAVASQLLSHLRSGGKPCIVGRQLRDGDYVLMNRQPTLHKPGIMAHRVRILHNPTQKTIRMHYANCNTYNADFDGDEMNCHFPQSDIARAEAQYIAKTDLQYIVPTDGSPLRGLIQDHVVGGVKLTKKDTFLEKWEYQQLLFACLATLPGLEIIRSDMEIKLLPPAIAKPRELWTGKQVITTLMLHLRMGNDQDTPEKSNFPGISMEFKSKTPENAFGAQQMEHRVLFIDGELVRGVLDKSAFGAANFSLVHAVYEAYGPEKAGLFLNTLSRLFTAYIQYFAGHSCRTEDLMLTKAADGKRKQLIQRAYNLGARAAKAWADSEGGKVPIAPVTEEWNRPLKPVESAAACAKIGELLSGNEGSENFASLDKFMQGQLNPLASDIVKESLPSGLVVAFPFNSFGIMTTTGAKGSIVNQSQVVCSLGQQALEGRRVPRLSSGRTLPSFAPYDPNPRADGFVMDRFLTGIRPQEYYFHCMAGREGLVDTAVKTSRSGYLQRCLMKHMEELLIGYDSTVRNAEGSVVQFLYGEDGLDPTKAPFLDCSDRTLEFLIRNHESMKRHSVPLPNSTIQIAAADASVCKALDGNLEALLQPGSRVLARRLREGTDWKRGAICRGWFEATIKKKHKHGKYFDLEYVEDGHQAKRVPLRAELGNCGGTNTAAATSIAELVKPAAFDPVLTSTRGGHRLGSSGACISERVAGHAYNAMKNNPGLQRAMSSVNVSARDLGKLVSAKYSSSLCAPGEAVGSIAAQSIGEPSTQMTLNTFHLAGAGVNVTLGIPRLREIIMTASRELKTPTMSVPLKDYVTDKQAIRLTRKFTKLTLMELICGYRGVTVTERLERGEAGNWSRAYYIKIKCHPAERIREAFGLSLHDVARVIAGSFVPKLSQLMKKELKRSAVEGDIGTVEVEGGHSTDYIETKDKGGDDSGPAPPAAATRDDLDDDADDDDDDGDAPGDEDGADSSRYRRRSQSVSYDDDDGRDGEAETATPPSSSTAVEEQEEDSDEATSAMFKGKDALHVNERANTISLQSLRVDPSARPLLMVGLVESAAATTVVRARKNINQAFINEEENGRGRCFQTAGINFEEIWKLDNVDHNRLMSNDIWAVRNAYGVEAAAASIKGQITSVFGAYGIEVDPRHLSLIADYMTLDGGFKAMNRTGMETSSSPFLQMSFETTAQFLRQAAIANDHDKLSSPSGNIVLGRPIRHGTGSFTLLAK